MVTEVGGGKACDNARNELAALSDVDGVSVFPFRYVMEEQSWEETSEKVYRGRRRHSKNVLTKLYFLNGVWIKICLCCETTETPC